MFVLFLKSLLNKMKIKSLNNNISAGKAHEFISIKMLVLFWNTLGKRLI